MTLKSNPYHLEIHKPMQSLKEFHQTIGNMIKSQQIFNREDIDEDNPWAGILTATMFGVRSTYHTTLQATPMQLVFGRDAIMPIKHRAEWKLIKDRKQKLINANNKRENAKYIKYNLGKYQPFTTWMHLRLENNLGVS